MDPEPPTARFQMDDRSRRPGHRNRYPTELCPDSSIGIMIQHNLVFLACFVLLSYFASPEGVAEDQAVSEQPADVLALDFAGLHLGCSVDELNRYFKETKASARSLSTDNDLKRATTTYNFDGHHAFKDSCFASYTFWDGKLIAVAVLFRGDDSERTYDALYSLAEKKFGTVTDELALLGKKCSARKGGMHFMLEFDSNPLGTASTSTMAIHSALFQQMDAASTKRRAEEIGGF